MKINTLQSNQPQSDTPPERIVTEELGLLDQTKKSLSNWWYKNTLSASVIDSQAPIQRVPVDTQVAAPPYIAPTKEQDTYIAWLWNLIWKQSSRSESIAFSADQVDTKTRKLFDDAKLEMQQKLESFNKDYQQFLSDDRAKAEGVLIKILVLLIKDQLAVSEEQDKLKGHRMNSDQKKLKQVQEQQAKNNEQLESIASKENKARIVAKVVGAAAGLAAFTTVALTTGGAAIGIAAPAIASTVAGYTTVGLNAAAATTFLIKEYFSGKTELAKKESILLQAQKELENEDISSSLQNIKNSLNEINTICTMLKEVAERQQEAISMMRR